MDTDTERSIEQLAQEHMQADDMAHDILHVLRVRDNALTIMDAEGGDRDVIVAAALLHDVVVYPKNDPRGEQEYEESATKAGELLPTTLFPSSKIEAVKTAIREHTGRHTAQRSSLESQIVHDADKLEKTGAVAIMRMFASTQQMQRPFYDADDPFAHHRERDQFSNTIDGFYTQLQHVPDKLYTRTAYAIAKRRASFLNDFLAEWQQELRGE